MFHRVFANPPPGRLDLVRLHLKGGHMREEPLLSMYFLLLQGIFTDTQDTQYSSLFTLHNLQSILHSPYYCYCYCFPCILSYTMCTLYTICAQCTQCVQCVYSVHYICAHLLNFAHTAEKSEDPVCAECARDFDKASLDSPSTNREIITFSSNVLPDFFCNL